MFRSPAYLDWSFFFQHKYVMPTITKLEKKKPKKRVYKKPENPEEGGYDVYATQMWRRIRKAYLMEHPLCEICLAAGRLTPASDVHHKNSFNQYSGSKRYSVAYDSNNLMSLCRWHHTRLHLGHKQPTYFDLEEYKSSHPEEFDIK